MNVLLKLAASTVAILLILFGESVAVPFAEIGGTATHALLAMGLLFLLFLTKSIPPFLRMMSLAAYLAVFGASMVLIEVPTHVHTNMMAALGGTLLALSLYPKLPGER